MAAPGVITSGTAARSARGPSTCAARCARCRRGRERDLRRCSEGEGGGLFRIPPRPHTRAGHERQDHAPRRGEGAGSGPRRVGALGRLEARHRVALHGHAGTLLPGSPPAWWRSTRGRPRWPWSTTASSSPSPTAAWRSTTWRPSSPPAMRRSPRRASSPARRARQAPRIALATTKGGPALWIGTHLRRGLPRPRCAARPRARGEARGTPCRHSRARPAFAAPEPPPAAGAAPRRPAGCGSSWLRGRRSPRPRLVSRPCAGRLAEAETVAREAEAVRMRSAEEHAAALEASRAVLQAEHAARVEALAHEHAAARETERAALEAEHTGRVDALEQEFHTAARETDRTRPLESGACGACRCSSGKSTRRHAKRERTTLEAEHAGRVETLSSKSTHSCARAEADYAREAEHAGRVETLKQEHAAARGVELHMALEAERMQGVSRPSSKSTQLRVRRTARRSKRSTRGVSRPSSKSMRRRAKRSGPRSKRSMQGVSKDSRAGSTRLHGMPGAGRARSGARVPASRLSSRSTPRPVKRSGLRWARSSAGHIEMQEPGARKASRVALGMKRITPRISRRRSREHDFRRAAPRAKRITLRASRRRSRMHEAKPRRCLEAAHRRPGRGPQGGRPLCRQGSDRGEARTPDWRGARRSGP